MVAYLAFDGVIVAIDALVGEEDLRAHRGVVFDVEVDMFIRACVVEEYIVFEVKFIVRFMLSVVIDCVCANHVVVVLVGSVVEGKVEVEVAFGPVVECGIIGIVGIVRV